MHCHIWVQLHTLLFKQYHAENVTKCIAMSPKAFLVILKNGQHGIIARISAHWVRMEARLSFLRDVVTKSYGDNFEAAYTNAGKENLKIDTKNDQENSTKGRLWNFNRNKMFYNTGNKWNKKQKNVASTKTGEGGSWLSFISRDNIIGSFLHIWETTVTWF